MVAYDALPKPIRDELKEGPVPPGASSVFMLLRHNKISVIARGASSDQAVKDTIRDVRMWNAHHCAASETSYLNVSMARSNEREIQAARR